LDYHLLKALHQTMVALSIAGFTARWIARLVGAAWVDHRAVRALPHVVDTLLLASGLGIAWTLHLTPSAAPWLTAKLVALVVYIGLGVIALRAGAPRGRRLVAGAAALVTFGYIVGVAVTKNAAWPAAFF
jgi:uncharacterized membrane protein SirB2